MSRSVCISNALTREIDRRKRWLDSESELLEVHFTVKIDRKTQRVRWVHIAVEAEHEVEEKAA